MFIEEEVTEGYIPSLQGTNTAEGSNKSTTSIFSPHSQTDLSSSEDIFEGNEGNFKLILQSNPDSNIINHCTSSIRSSTNLLARNGLAGADGSIPSKVGDKMIKIII